MAGNMLMINVGVNSKDAENSLASLEETLKNISKKDADLKVGENLATEVENARKKYLDMVKMVNSTEGELQKAFAISGLKQTIADIEALNKKISETGAKIKPIELQSVMFDGKELFDIKGIDKSLNKFAKKLDKESNDAFANILTTNLGQQFFSKQKIELEKQLETDLKNLAKDFSQDKLEQYINKYLKIRSIDVAKNGKDKIATSGVTPKAITDLIDNKAISKQLAEGKIDVKAMFQKKATDVGFVKNMKDQIFSELMAFLNQNTDANTFGTKYTDAQMTEMTQGAKESKKQTKLLKEELENLINTYNKFDTINGDYNKILDTIARIESLRKELKGLGEDITKIGAISDQDIYNENAKTLKNTLSIAKEAGVPDSNDDYYDEDYDAYLNDLLLTFKKLQKINVQNILSSGARDASKIDTLKQNLSEIDELIIKANSYDSLVAGFSDSIIGDIEILKNQREQIIAGLKKLNVDVAGVGIPMADYIAGGNKGSGGNSSGTGSGDGNGNGAGSGTGNGGVMTPEEMEKLKKDYADLTAEVEKYKAQITETTAKLEEMKKTQAESEGDKNKIKELQASLDALNVSYAEAQNKMKEYRSELAAYESMSLVQDANGNNVNQEQYDKLISDAKQTATELENTRNQLKMLQEQAVAGGSDEYVVQLNNQLKSTETMLNKVTNELEYMESSRNRWMDRAEMNAVIDESGQSVYQNDYDNIVAKLSEMKTEAQNAKDELEKLKATSVQLGEGEQVAKTSDIEAVNGLSEAVKSLQDRMTKAEEILKEVPKGMDGLKKLSSQIQKMSGNFNEDGSIKSMGISAEALSEQLKNLDAEFDARIAKKIEEIEKKSYKENQPKQKFKLAESVKSLKVVAAQTAPKVEVQQVNNDIKSAQQDATVKAEEITKELYKETEGYKALSKAVQKYNALTSQKLDATAYDARIERMQKMQALVASIIETVEKYEGKASELSELTLKSKNGNIGIQDTVKLDELMSKLKAGEAKNISKKEQTEQLKQDAQKYVDVVRDYNNKFQSIISQKVSSGKQFNSVKQQLNDLSNSIDAIMDKYDQFKGQDFYSAEFASYGEKLRGTVKDSSLDLNEITKFKGYEQEILSIQLKYSESLQKQKKEQDAVAEAARKKAEAEKEAVKAAEETTNEMSVAEKSREEQKRKALERQAAQNGNQTSNINSAPPDNTTLSAILTEVKSINGKMGGTQSVDVNIGNSPNLKVDGAVSEIKAQSDAMEQAAEKEVAAIQRVANEGKKQFREADMYYYESAKKNANNIYKATIDLSLENGGDRTDEMYRIVNETNKDFFANLRTMYDSAYESVKKIDDVVRKIGKDSSVSKIDIDDIPNESVATLEKVKQLCEEGKSNTVEYISEVQKLFKLFDKYGTDFGNVKQSGAKNKAEYETWIRRSISEASNGKFDNDWFVDNLINEQFYSTSGTHRTLSEIISELFGDINYHSNKRDVIEYKKILDYYENNKERIHSQKSDYLSGNYIIESFDEEISRIREETNALNTNTEAKKENAQAGQVITNVDNGMTPVSNESTSSAISSGVQAASEAATAEVQAFNTIDDAVTGLTGDINTKTEAIRAEQQTMATAAESEVASVSQIKQAFVELTTQIQNVPKVRIVGENDGKLNISANLTEEQIAVIREKLKAAFSGEQAIPISFVPNVEGLKQQIADALKNVPVEITNNNINKVIKVNKFKANSDGVEALRNSISSQLKNVKIQSFDATTAAESVKETLSKVLDGVGLKFDTEKLGNEVREAVSSGVEAASAEQKPETSDNKAVRFKEKATNDIGKLRDKYTDKLQGQQLEVFKERLNEIDNKIKEIKDDASNYTDENAQVIDKDIKQIEALVNSFKEINDSEDKINSLIQKLKDSKNNIERRGAVAQPVVNNINSEMSALEELKRSGQNLNVGNPAEVQAFIDKLHEADATVESLQQSAKDIRVSTNTTASVAKLDSKFNDLLFKVDKFKRDNSKITSDKGISAQFDSLLRSIQTIEKSDVNFQRLRAQFDQLKATVQGKGLTGRSLGDELKYIAEKIGIKAMLGNSIYRVIGAFRQMVGIVTELDTGMTTLRRVTEATEKQYAQFMKNATASAHELGSAISDVVNATGEFSKLGYNLDEATKLGEAAATYANVGFMDISSSIESMTSVMQGFKLSADEAMSVVDKMDLIGNKFSISSAGIGAALQRSASSLVAAGNDLDEAISLVTAGNTVLQDPESVANGIKIISLRIRSAKSEISELGESTDDMVESSAKLQQKVQAIAGVNIMKDDNTFKSTYQILSEIANKWSELSDIDQANCSPYVQQCA